MSYEIRNIVKLDDECFDCEYKDEEGNWIGYTVCSYDKEYLARDLYSEINSGKYGDEFEVYTQPPKTKSEIEAMRKAAYANPFTGSDRLFAEAQRMQLMNEPGWEDIRDQAIQRFTEIQNQYPWE